MDMGTKSDENAFYLVIYLKNSYRVIIPLARQKKTREEHFLYKVTIALYPGPNPISQMIGFFVLCNTFWVCQN